jgi:homoserine dehydrogenase
VAATRVRVAVVGLGTVGRWLLDALNRQRDLLRPGDEIELQLVAAGRRSGFVHRASGLAPAELLGTDCDLDTIDGVDRWPTALDGLREIEYDVLAEVSQSPMGDGEPGLTHMREALTAGASVATSNKWPVALAGLELAGLARSTGAGFRAESTVMSGTPLLTAITDGLGGARPVRMRGILNATVNFICSRMATGATYADALAEAQAKGLAEPDPGADVDGFDSVAKVMVLSALVFGRELALGDVSRRGISAVDPDEVAAAAAQGMRIREVARLHPASGVAAVEAAAVGPDDPLFAIEETTNALRLEVEPLGEITVTGPGAGPQLAGQGVFSDLIALARHATRT